jgi:hypothetical protein
MVFDFDLQACHRVLLAVVEEGLAREGLVVRLEGQLLGQQLLFAREFGEHRLGLLQNKIQSGRRKDITMMT